MARTALSAAQVIETLGLVPHPKEGGYFIETWRSDRRLSADVFDGVYNGPRAAGTAIYYLLTPQTFSALHRLKSDEVFHFYLGDPVEMLHLYPHGRHERVVLGTDLLAGERPQAVVPAGVWQGARLVDGGSVALLGCTVAPGFDYADYDHGERAPLLEGWPRAAAMIDRLIAPALD